MELADSLVTATLPALPSKTASSAGTQAWLYVPNDVVDQYDEVDLQYFLVEVYWKYSAVAWAKEAPPTGSPPPEYKPNENCDRIS